MLSRIPHLGPLVHWLATQPPPRHLVGDDPHPSPRTDHELTIRWLGTAGFAIEHRGHTLLIDPYVTRPGLLETVFCPLRPDRELIRRFIPRADTIVCGHAHHDHLLDIPEIARLHDARVLGSPNTCNYCRAMGLDEVQLSEVVPPWMIQRGPFRITLRHSIHSRVALGRIHFKGRIPRDAHIPLRINRFLIDGAYGVLVEIDGGPSIFHLGSADFLPQTIEGLTCDVLLLCLAGRGRHPGLTGELLTALGPRVVIPCHFDDFLVPMDRPLRVLPGIDLEGFDREVRRSGVPCQVVFLDRLASYTLEV